MRLPWVLTEEFYHDARCEEILADLQEGCSMEEGGIQSTNHPDPRVRRSAVGWPSQEKHKGLFDEIKGLVHDINQKHWKFILGGEIDWQLTYYTASSDGFYRRHMDLNTESTSDTERKLSLTLQLSDPSTYAGGTLEMGSVRQPYRRELRARGNALVFPSFLEHSVSPVLYGDRWSLVAWFSGPNFV